jgi:hypothetical protein
MLLLMMKKLRHQAAGRLPVTSTDIIETSPSVSPAESPSTPTTLDTIASAS